jgi:hypothetical protein
MLVDNGPPEVGDLPSVLILDDLEAGLDGDGIFQQFDEYLPIGLFYLVVVAILQRGTFEHFFKGILDATGVDKQSIVEGADLFKAHIGIAKTGLVHLIFLESAEGLLDAGPLIAF